MAPCNTAQAGLDLGAIPVAAEMELRCRMPGQHHRYGLDDVVGSLPLTQATERHDDRRNRFAPYIVRRQADRIADHHG